MMKLFRILVRRVVGLSAALVITAGLFLVLPLMQQISESPKKYETRTASVQPPEPPPPEPEKEEEPPPEPEDPPDPPEFTPDPPKLDISQMDLTIRAGLPSGITNPNNTLPRDLVGGGELMDDLFQSLDQEPKATQPLVQPSIDDRMRSVMKRGKVVVMVGALVDANGRVVKAKVLTPPNRLFDRPALRAIKQQGFEPARRKGKAVQAYVRQRYEF